MRSSVRHNSKRAKGLANQLAAEKKKVVVALCLIGVMAIMWIRVFTKKAPEAAGADIAVNPPSSDVKPEPELKISYIELPKVAGRNDVIIRDVFASENWRHFIERQRKRNGIEEVNILSSDVNEEVIGKLTEKLKLEAVMVSEDPRAYVNGKTIKVGDKLLIGDGNDRFECEVVAIEENTVVMRCKEAKITLKLVEESKSDS